MNVVAFEAWHWNALCPREGDVIDGGMWGGATQTYTRTLMAGVAPVAVMGVAVPYQGLGYVWARVSDDVRGQGLALSRATLRCLEEARLVLAPRQLRCQVRLDNPEYMAWIWMLGFDPESIKQGAAPGGGDLVEYVQWMKSSAPLSLRSRRRSTTVRSGPTIRRGNGTSRRATALN